MKAPRSIPDPFLLTVLALSLGLNVWQGVKLRGAPSGKPAEAQLHVGDTLPALSAVDPQGQSVDLSAQGDSRPTVYYAFSTSCPWCKKNSAAVAALANQRSPQYRFVGLCMSDKESCASSELRPPFPTYTGLAPEQVKALGLTGVPQTIVVSPQGKVQQVFQGAWTNGQKEEVERFFSLSLPDLVASPTHAGAPSPAKGG